MLQVNNALWILVIGVIFVLVIVIFIVALVISAKIWVNRSFNDCMNKIKEIEKEFETIKKASINITEIKETLSDVEKLLKNKK